MRTYLVTIAPRGFPLAQRLENSLRAAARAMRLQHRLARVHVRIRPHLSGDDASVRWHALGSRVAVRIDTDLGNFLSARARRLARARRMRLFMNGSGALGPHAFPVRRWSEREAHATFLHELAHVADEFRFGIDATRVSARSREPFHEAWNVWIDGRLARRGWSSLSRRDRLREFRKALGPRARSTVVLPAFERLWGAQRLRQRDLLDVVERLVR